MPLEATLNMFTFMVLWYSRTPYSFYEFTNTTSTRLVGLSLRLTSRPFAPSSTGYSKWSWSHLMQFARRFPTYSKTRYDSQRYITLTIRQYNNRISTCHLTLYRTYSTLLWTATVSGSHCYPLVLVSYARLHMVLWFSHLVQPKMAPTWVKRKYPRQLMIINNGFKLGKTAWIT